jgi:hypothetical protein
MHHSESSSKRGCSKVVVVPHQREQMVCRRSVLPLLPARTCPNPLSRATEPEELQSGAWSRRYPEELRLRNVCPGSEHRIGIASGTFKQG